MVRVARLAAQHVVDAGGHPQIVEELGLIALLEHHVGRLEAQEGALLGEPNEQPEADLGAPALEVLRIQLLVVALAIADAGEDERDRV